MIGVCEAHNSDRIIEEKVREFGYNAFGGESPKTPPAIYVSRGCRGERDRWLLVRHYGSGLDCRHIFNESGDPMSRIPLEFAFQKVVDDERCDCVRCSVPLQDSHTCSVYI